MRITSFAILLALSAGARVLAADAPAADAPAASQPATSKPADAAVIDVKDAEALKAAIGKEATVTGKCTATFKPRSGSVIIVNFDGVNREFVAVIEKDNMETVSAGFGGDVDAAFKGKMLTITGPIKLYREKPEMVISKPDQVKISEAPKSDEKPADDRKQ